MKKILITGSAGFIGFHLAKRILETSSDTQIIGLDNLNDYYDVSLKQSRLEILSGYQNFTFLKGDLADRLFMEKMFSEQAFDLVVHLGAQAGVRYSIENPHAYINSNIVGFLNILEGCRQNQGNLKHLIYASSSSVYGMQEKTPFSTEDDVSKPISLYAATKKSNELMAHTYSHLYGFPTTGLRFFTVYGPYGRPDMAYFSFAKAILEGKPIKIFNHGDMLRDFTYIDDIVGGIMAILQKEEIQGEQSKVYNIGNNKPEKLLHFVEVLEDALSRAYGRKLEAVKEFLPMQAGDVYQTFADIAPLTRDFGFQPSTSIEEGLERFAKWYRIYGK